MLNRILKKDSCFFLFILVFLYMLSDTGLGNPVEQINGSLQTWITHAQQSIQKKILPNGLTVLFYQVQHTPQVDIRVSVNVGSRDEQPGQYGLAHMVEHMIFKGTSKLSEVAIRRIADKFGARCNACTTNDQTIYFCKTDNKNWQIFLNILADCMQNTRFDANHFASEVKTVISELNLRRSNVGIKLVDEMIIKSFPIGHPYHHPIIGLREDLVNASAEDLKSFYTSHYTPKKTVISVVGNIDGNILFDQVEKLFGTFQSASAQPSVPFNQDAFLPPDFIQQHSIIHTQTTNPSTSLYWLMPGQKYQSSILGDTLCYILQERLRMLKDPNDLVYSWNVFNLTFFDAGIFWISFEPKTDKHHAITQRNEQIRILIENEIQNLMTYGPKTKELLQFKQITLNEFANGFEYVDFIATVLSQYCLNKNEFEAFDRLRFAQNISKEDIKNFCKQHLSPHATHQIDCLPLEDKEKHLWQQLQHQIDEYEKKLLSETVRQSPLEPELQKLPEPIALDLNFQKPDLVTTLSNGLTVYLKQQPHAPHLVLSCGFYDSEKKSLIYGYNKKEDVPSLAMSLLSEGSKGTQEHPDEFNKKEHIVFFDQLGATFTIGSNSINLTCLPDDLQKASTRLLHILTHPTYPQKSFDQAIDNISQKITLQQNDANYRANRALMQYLYKDYPWIYTDQEILNHLKGCTRQDLITCHQHHVQPKKMFLVLVGNIDISATVDLLEKIFGSWQGENSLVIDDQLTIPDITSQPGKTITISVPHEQVIIKAGRLTTVKGTDEARALLIIEDYVNRMLFNIREQTGLFYTCHVSLAPLSYVIKNNTYLSTQVSPQNAHSALQEVKDVLKNIACNGIPASYLIDAQRNYTARVAKLFTTNAALVDIYEMLINNSKPFTYFDDQIEQINNLSLSYVNEVARKYCDPETWTFVLSGSVPNDVAP